MYLVVPFRNESVIGREHKYSAHIAYKRMDGSEIAEVTLGSWFPVLPNPQNTFFELKVTKELAVLRLEDGKLFTGEIKWFHHYVSRLSIWEPDPEGDEIREPIGTVEVTLRSGNRSPLSFVFDVSTNSDGQPTLRWQAPSRA